MNPSYSPFDPGPKKPVHLHLLKQLFLILLWCSLLHIQKMYFPANFHTSACPVKWVTSAPANSARSLLLLSSAVLQTRVLRAAMDVFQTPIAFLQVTYLSSYAVGGCSRLYHWSELYPITRRIHRGVQRRACIEYAKHFYPPGIH